MPTSRRHFLSTIATAIAASAFTTHLRADEETTDEKLQPYDDLMNTFMKEHSPPGTALAVTYHGRLVYARGFGFADVENQERVRATSLFRIASISKPVTATAIMRLVDDGKLNLDDPIVPLIKLDPFLEKGATYDKRLNDVTIRHCLQHTGGWDRDKTFEPIHSSPRIATALKARLPLRPQQIIRYMLGKPLDFDPGTAFAYANFGYCLLGRLIEKTSGKPYDQFVKEQVFKPLGIQHMQLGKDPLTGRASGEVKYYDQQNRTCRADTGPKIGQTGPLAYGCDAIEIGDSGEGWIASAVDLARFAVAFDDPQKCPILSEKAIHTMVERPKGAPGHEADGKPKPTYYGCGWKVRPVSKRFNKWHDGRLTGSNSTMLVCRYDRINWAVLFNAETDNDSKPLATQIDSKLYELPSQIKAWPDVDLFPKYV